MTCFNNIFFILCFSFCLGQEVDSTNILKSNFEIESISIENFEEKHFLDNTFVCKKYSNQFKKVKFLNIELFLPENDSISFDEHDGRLQQHSWSSFEDVLTFSLLEAYNTDDANHLYNEFQTILIDGIFNGQTLDFGVIDLDNLNKSYWIKSDVSTEEISLYLLTILFEDVNSEKIYMIILSSTGNLNEAICKYYKSIKSIQFNNY